MAIARFSTDAALLQPAALALAMLARRDGSRLPLLQAGAVPPLVRLLNGPAWVGLAEQSTPKAFEHGGVDAGYEASLAAERAARSSPWAAAGEWGAPLGAATGAHGRRRPALASPIPQIPFGGDEGHGLQVCAFHAPLAAGAVVQDVAGSAAAALANIAFVEQCRPAVVNAEAAAPLARLLYTSQVCYYWH